MLKIHFIFQICQNTITLKEHAGTHTLSHTGVSPLSCQTPLEKPTSCPQQLAKAFSIHHCISSPCGPFPIISVNTRPEDME